MSNAESTPLYYDLVPRDPEENLEWRIACRERALKDKRFQDALWQACMDDLLFFMGFCCYGFDPRARVKVVPFIPHPHQEKVFTKLDEAIDTAEREERSVDVIVDKARAQGGTYGYLWTDLRRWLRDRMFSAGYVTRNEDLVDSKTDSNTVLWKIAWAIELLPAWMQPKYERHLGQHTFINEENGSLLRGYAAGQDVAAGGRATVFTCLAGGTLVVTNRGNVPIEEVTSTDLVWDGINWLSHGGLVYRGERETILAYGVRLTPDHLVFTKKGWKYAIDGFDRTDVRLPDGYSSAWEPCSFERKEGRCDVAVQMPMRQGSCRWGQPAERHDQELRMLEEGSHGQQGTDSRKVPNADVSGMASGCSSMYGPELQRLPVLWETRCHYLREVAEVRELSGGHGGTPGSRSDARASGQLQGVLKRKLPLGNPSRAGEQHAEQPCSRDISWADDDCRIGTGDRNKLQLHQGTHQERLDGGRSFASTQNPTSVYDLLNCGPRRAFTVIDDCGRPLLVHNCDEFGARDFVAASKDEAVMESLHDVTGCIRMVSARYVDQGVFHRACENPDTAKNGVYLVLDWKDHPAHGKNIYVVKDGTPKAVRPEDQEAVDEYHRRNRDLRGRLERKGFKFEGVVRSPWYDMRCLRPTATPRLIASQLDRNPRGAVGKVFPSDLLDQMKEKHCKPPVWVGTPVFDSETLKLTGLIRRDDGPLKLWFKPGIDNTPPIGPFTAGCDIASGGVSEFATNSTMSAMDDRTGEQVLEYAIKGMEPRPFARRVVGLCMWLRNALLGWEDSGVSGGFAKEIMEVIYYGNVFLRDVTQLGSQKKSRKPGWPCRDADKSDMFEQMALAMEAGKYIPRSEAMITECGEYEWDGTKIVHAPTKNKGAADKNHADRAVAAGGCWLVYSIDKARSRIDTTEEGPIIPEYGSFLWRELQERKDAKVGNPRFGIRDVVGW